MLVNKGCIFICTFPGRYLQHLVSIMSPVYWTTATEVGEASNGWTLTEGKFRREVQVEFATGKYMCFHILLCLQCIEGSV